MGAKGRIKLNGSLPNGSQEALPWKKRGQEKKEKGKKLLERKTETKKMITKVSSCYMDTIEKEVFFGFVKYSKTKHRIFSLQAFSL